MKFSRVSRDFFCSLVIAVERPFVNQLAYPYRPQSFVSSEKESIVRGLNSL